MFVNQFFKYVMFKNTKHIDQVWANYSGNLLYVWSKNNKSICPT